MHPFDFFLFLVKMRLNTVDGSEKTWQSENLVNLTSRRCFSAR